jgi:hypothetical protein
VGVFFAVGGQTSWILRPYLVRPRTEQVPFVRAREGSFADALLMSSRSARGIYKESVLEQVEAMPVESEGSGTGPRVRSSCVGSRCEEEL